VNEEYFVSGHRGCAGCGPAIAMRHALKVAGPNTIATFPTGCVEVMSTAYPETAWTIPWIHVAFENSAAVASGIDAALKALRKRKGKNIIAFGGDGGTFDIGLQALSGMLERGHNVTYICYDNEAYMNTGIQRCSSTPFGAWTTTSPPGKLSVGKEQQKKPLAAIVAAHDIPYTATASIGYLKDYKNKVKKALETEGPSFIHVLVPCPTGWRFPSRLTVELAKLAVQTGAFVLWELEGADMRNMKITKKVPKRKPIVEYFKLQGRFKHILKDEKLIAKIQKDIDEKCERYGV